MWSRCFIFTVSVSVLIFLLILNPLYSQSPRKEWPLFLVQYFGAAQQNPAAGDCCAKLGDATARLRSAVTFLPLKDIRLASRPMEGTTWFMSSVNDTLGAGDVAQHLHFPSPESAGRLLCLAGGSTNDGASNSYAFAWPDALPNNALLLQGLTFVSDTYYDYRNPWHGLSALLPFVGWHRWRGCARPDRWVLYHWGELRPQGMGKWVKEIAASVFGCGEKQEREEVPVMGADAFVEGTPVCFQEAVVFRHNEGSMPKERRRELYDVIRHNARKRCGVDVATAGGSEIRLTLFLRTGARSFRNESTVIQVFDQECRNVPGCRITVSRPDNLTFCQQVELMTTTDVLVTQHGAQLTNMIFMDRNSSIMEFFPKGWLDLAGVGQYVYHWLADWSGMQHEVAWRDEDVSDMARRGEALPCPHPKGDIRCFLLYKDGVIGFNGTQVATWTKGILQRVKERKLDESGQRKVTLASDCPCD